MQTWDLIPSNRPEGQSLLRDTQVAGAKKAILSRPSTLQIAREAYQADGMQVFFRGLAICNARAFVVNAVQFFVSQTYLTSTVQ